MTAMPLNLENLGWRTFLQNRQGTSKITINKLVAVGTGLDRFDHLYCYLDKINGRAIMVVYLDGKPKDHHA